MDENWAALFISIYKSVPPEAAFFMIENAKPISDIAYTTVFTEKDTEDMVKLREMKITYREIREMYGLKDCTVFTRIKRFKGTKSIKKEA